VRLLGGPVAVRRPLAGSCRLLVQFLTALPAQCHAGINCALAVTAGPVSPTAHLLCAPRPCSAMLASTDALAITAVLRRAGGPESLETLMEGESLLNDASGKDSLRASCSIT